MRNVFGKRLAVGVMWAVVPLLEGCFFLKVGDAVQEGSLKPVRDLSRFLSVTSFSRSSAGATAIRLKQLFPRLDVEAKILGEKEYSGVSVADKKSSEIFTRLDRPATAIPLTVLRQTVSDHCGRLNGAINVFNAPDIMLSTDTQLESDADEKLAFYAARNVFLYPYAMNSPLVSEIAQALRGARAEGADAEKEVCIALIMSPQFWLGNAEPYDWIRRAALEIGGRLPTSQDYEALMVEGASKEQWFKSLINSDGYFERLKPWLTDWLGLESYRTRSKTAYNVPTLYRGDHYGGFPSHLGGVPTKYDAVLLDDGQYHKAIKLSVGGLSNLESCRPRVQSTFRPEADRLQWEFWDTETKRWYFVVGQERVGNSFVERTNSFDSSISRIRNLVGFTPSLQDITEVVGAGTLTFDESEIPDGAPTSVPSMKWADWPIEKGWEFPVGAGATSPISGVSPGYERTVEGKTIQYSGVVTFSEGGDTYGSGSRFSKTKFRIVPQYHVRVRRWAKVGSSYEEQNGYSKVTLPITREEVYVCNTLSRIALTCAFRLDQFSNNGGPFMARDFGFNNGSPSKSKIWRASENYVSEQENVNFTEASLFSGPVLDSARCGMPSGNWWKKAEDYLPTEKQADLFPKGSLGAYNDVAYNIQISAPASAVTRRLENEVFLEAEALHAVGFDLDMEPYHLFKFIVENDRDFRELVTANYTIGRKPLEYFLRTMAMPLPPDPPGFRRDGNESNVDQAPYKVISYQGFDPIPGGFLVNGSKSTEPVLSENGSKAKPMDQVEDLTSIEPKRMSGILTQQAFMTPMSPKIRGFAARFYQRLLCRLPSGIPLSSSEKSLHQEYMIPNPAHLKEDCYECHVHLDALASALSMSFLSGSDVERVSGTSALAPSAAGEIWHFGRIGNKPYWGIRGRGNREFISEGAFLGEKVQGIQEVGEVLSESPIFSRCVTDQAFLFVFGRAASFAENDMLQELSEQFESHRSFNKLVLDLMSTKSFQEVR